MPISIEEEINRAALLRVDARIALVTIPPDA
jgi:hypothetical protein